MGGLRGPTLSERRAVMSEQNQVTVESSQCKEIPFAEDYTDFIDEYEPPDAEIRGNLKVCSGCLRRDTCAYLLPGMAGK